MIIKNINTEGLDIPCHNKHISFEGIIKFLPDSIRNEIRLLVKQYDIITIEQLDQDETYTDSGGTISTIMENINYSKKYIIPQLYDVKIEYRNRETGQMFFKVFKSY